MWYRKVSNIVKDTIMAKKKRNTRKDLLIEPDQVATLLSRITQFVAEHQKKMYAGLAGIVVIGLIVFGLHYFSRVSEDKAYVLFDQGVETRQNIEAEKDGKTTAEISIEDFDTILKKYPKTEAARLTLLTYGDYYYEKGNYDKALELYIKALKAFSDDYLTRAFILNGIGYCYEGKNEYKTATEYFMEIVNLENSILKDSAHFNLARIYETMGDIPNALIHYQKITKDYPESSHAQKAQAKVSHLGPYAETFSLSE